MGKFVHLDQFEGWICHTNIIKRFGTLKTIKNYLSVSGVLPIGGHIVAEIKTVVTQYLTIVKKCDLSG